MSKSVENHISTLIERYPSLTACVDDIISGYGLLENCFKNGHKLLISGNGGSAADSEHIAGELLKQFKIPRPIKKELAESIKKIDPIRGERIVHNLQEGLPALPLVSLEAMTTAFINDVNGFEVFAQQLYCFGRPGDVFLAISTSGNSENIISAAIVARTVGIKVLGLTGTEGGELRKVADICVRAPSSITDRIQELHLPIYHCWCMMLEEKFFGSPNPK